MGTVTPVGLDVQSTWDAVVHGRSGVAPVTLFDTSDLNVRIAGEVKDFDATRYLDRKEARRMASVIANSAPLVIRTLRDFANQTLPRGPAEIFVPERYKLERIAGSDDRKEGAAAFREKRPAKFKGR